MEQDTHHSSLSALMASPKNKNFDRNLKFDRHSEGRQGTSKGAAPEAGVEEAQTTGVTMLILSDGKT